MRIVRSGRMAFRLRPVHIYQNFADTRHLLQRFANFAFHNNRDIRIAGRNVDLNMHNSVINDYTFDDAEGNDIPRKIRIFNALEKLEDFFLE